MKLDKLLYVTVHIMTPMLLLVVGIFWDHFINVKPIYTALTDNFSIVAIYYLIVTVMWAANLKTIRCLSAKEEV